MLSLNNYYNVLLYLRLCSTDLGVRKKTRVKLSLAQVVLGWVTSSKVSIEKNPKPLNCCNDYIGDNFNMNEFGTSRVRLTPCFLRSGVLLET